MKLLILNSDIKHLSSSLLEYSPISNSYYISHIATPNTGEGHPFKIHPVKIKLPVEGATSIGIDVNPGPCYDGLYVKDDLH